MEKTAEQKMVLDVPVGRKIIKTPMKTSKDGRSVEVILTTEVIFDELFPIINPSKLIGHELLEHKPKTREQEKLLTCILRSIEMKLPAFRVSCIDPSWENGKIVFISGNKPLTHRTPAWWDKTWKDFMPSKNSRSGTELHYAIFLGDLMKYLIEKRNCSVEDAWEAVCDDSRDLGHYYDSEDAKHDFEPTGSRQVGVFYDLANTCKILKEWDSSCFLLAGGSHQSGCKTSPLADIGIIRNIRQCFDISVGWLVMDV